MLKQLSRARLIWLIAIVLVVAFVIYRCSAGGEDAPEYQTALVEKSNVVSRVSTSGSLQAVVTVDVGSQVSGMRLEKVVAASAPYIPALIGVVILMIIFPQMVTWLPYYVYPK